MLRSTGVGVFRSPFHFFYCQTYRGGLSIYRKFRVEISTRSAYLFGLRFPGQLLFPIVAPFPFVLCPAFIPWVPFRHFDPVYFYFGTGEHLAEKFRHCSHLLWDVERLRLLMLRANPPNRAIVAILIPHNLRPAYRLL